MLEVICFEKIAIKYMLIEQPVNSTEERLLECWGEI